ncbi:MAG: putative bifunctional diguanylate cyclase/phosphodiesterase, partial [Thermoanaerobaculia bacterium]
ADEAMHECKQAGGNGWQLQRESINERALERLGVEMDLHRAIDRGEFVVRYQPLLNVAQQEMVAVEALVRWQHPERGELPPLAFLDVAEETGMIVAIGEQVIKLACAQARQWLEEGWENVSIAINLSPRQFNHPGLLELLDRAVSDNGVPGHVLQVEITERTALGDLERTLRVLADLHARGIRVAIDDFGIGYSSLAYLKQLTIDALKIDKAFLTEVPSGRDGAIVAAVIAMGHALGLTVIAEGVERQDQMNFLREHGCDVCQGFLFSEPTTAAEITRMRRQ